MEIEVHAVCVCTVIITLESAFKSQRLSLGTKKPQTTICE